MNILWNSDAHFLPTGYAMVSRNLCTRFKKSGIDVNYMAFQNQGMPITTQMFNESYNFPTFFQLHHDEFYGNKDSVLFWANELKPDVVAFLSDSFMLSWIKDKKPKWKEITGKHNTKSLFYFPFDSDDVYDGAKQVMEQIDIRVAMAKFAQATLKKYTDLDSYYIPHGVDLNVFRPLTPEHKLELKKQAGFENKFVVGSVMRNQSRKMIPNLLYSFKEFIKDKPDAVLYLHCDPLDPQGWNLFDLCNRLELSGKVFFGLKRYSLGIPEARLNMVYNLFDVHVLPTTGEGFGLPIIESQSCGVPNIATDYTTSRELIEGHGELVPLCQECPYIIGQLNTKRGLISIPKLTESMNKLYYNEQLRKQYSKDSIDFVQQFSWEKIVQMWLDLFEKEL